MISKYYTRLRLDRLASLLDTSIDEAERVLSKLVTDKTVYARIDRPAGTLTFGEAQSPAVVMNEWAGDVSKLLASVAQTTHLISKEHALHAALQNARARS